MLKDRIKLDLRKYSEEGRDFYGAIGVVDLDKYPALIIEGEGSVCKQDFEKLTDFTK